MDIYFYAFDIQNKFIIPYHHFLSIADQLCVCVLVLTACFSDDTIIKLTRTVKTVGPVAPPKPEFDIMLTPSLVPSIMADDNELVTTLNKTSRKEETEIMDEFTVETKVTQVKMVQMELSHSGDVSLLETTEVHTDTGMTEHRKSREREETQTTQRVINRKSLTHTPPGTPLAIRTYPETSTPYKSPTGGHSPHNLSVDLGNQSFSRSGASTPARAVGSELDTFSIASEPISIEEEVPIYVAVYSYEPESDDVLALHEGEKVEVIDDTGDDWWKVRRPYNQRTGMAPCRYLKERDEYEKMVDDKIYSKLYQLSSQSCKNTYACFVSITL